MARKNPVLSLSTLAPDRPVIEIDGTHYEISLPDDISIVGTTRLDVLTPIMLDFSASNQDVDSSAAVADAFKEMVGIVVREITPEINDKLVDQQRILIVNLFTSTANKINATQTPVKGIRQKKKTPKT